MTSTSLLQQVSGLWTSAAPSFERITDRAVAHLGSIGLVDLVIGLVVIGSLVGALRRRSGLFGAIGSAIGALVVCWLVTTALVAWGPPEVRSLVADSAFARTVPLPVDAFRQAAVWLDPLIRAGRS